jgi:hypothetical protein
MAANIIAEVVAGEIVPDATGRYEASEWLYVTLKVPLSRAKDFPMGSSVRVAPAPRRAPPVTP